MRMILTLVAGASVIMAMATPALARPENYVRPTVAQMQMVREHRDPCNSVSNNPHELSGLQAIQDACRHRMAQRAAHPDDLALREACAQAARALTGQPC
ncbi:MAG TPA: hypothetical protein VG735_15220 [Caulobacterales bacterium]|nr:hypothetical protein [Caulobacterales bacterium]